MIRWISDSLLKWPPVQWLSRVLGYLLAITALTWPLMGHLSSMLPGFPNVDSGDTVWLRGLVGPTLLSPSEWPTSYDVFWPSGYPVLLLTPNVMDHTLGGMLGWVFPFPLADNLLWVGSLLAAALAAHHLGRTLAVGRKGLSREGAGWLMGLGWIACDALLREVNLHHAPQTLCFWIPLYLACFHRLLQPSGRWRDAFGAGLFILGAALSYWYLALFAALGSLPMLLGAARGMSRQSWMRFGAAAGIALLFALPALAPFALSWDQLPLTSPESAPAPLNLPADYSALAAAKQFEAGHGAPLWFPFVSGPIDRSNRISWVLTLGTLAALGLAWRQGKLKTLLPWLAMAAVAYIMILGPWLKWGEELVLIGGNPVSMPFEWLGWVHPFLDRLTWPERWGMILPLGLLAAACMHLPRPGLWGSFLVIEAMLLSGNAPIQTQDLSEEMAWTVVAAADGAVLELPLRRDGLHAPVVGRHQRMHGHPVVNPLLLPPGAPMPDDWQAWTQAQELLIWLEALESGGKPAPPPESARQDLAKQGVGAVALDALPGNLLPKNRLNRRIRELSQGLGEPEDHGAVVIWWLRPPAPHAKPTVDGAQWRASADRSLGLTPVPEFESLIDPIWNAQQGRDLED
ncbi:MAG: hypothetical protein ACI9VR_003141 [Cognaticolwellia sp.]